jgi:hypothetical protein
MEANGATSRSAFSTALHEVGELPARLETGLKTHPFVTTATIAGVAFLGGMALGSRVVRAVLVAAAPAIMRRLLDGPLGDDLERYICGAFRRPAAASVTAS